MNKKNIIKSISLKAGSFLALMATVFAVVPCEGKLYETKVPSELINK